MTVLYFAGANYRIKGEHVPGKGYHKAFSTVHPGDDIPYVYLDGIDARRAFLGSMQHHSALYRTTDFKSAQRVVIGPSFNIPIEDMPDEIIINNELANKLQQAAAIKERNADRRN